MRTIATVCVSLLVSATFFIPSLAHSQDDVAGLDDVVLLQKSDISEQTILTFLKYRKIGFALDTEALDRLRESGVSEKIISYMLIQNTSPVTATPAYVVATGYNSPLPSYYFGTRLVGATEYPLSWYQHRYSPLGIASVYRSNTHFDQFLNDGHAPGSALRDSIHAPRVHGGNNRIDHSADRPVHYGGNQHSLSGRH